MDIVKKLSLWLVIALLLVGTCLGVYFGIRLKNLNQTQVEDNLELVITISDLRKNISALEKEKASLVVQIDELKENNKELTNSLANETNDNSLLREQIEKNNALIAQLEQNISNLQSQITDLNRQIILLQNENNNLQSEIDSFNTLTPITLDFTEAQLKNGYVEMFLSGKTSGAGVSTFVNVKGSFKRDNQCVIISNIIDGDGYKGLGYTCFTYDVNRELTADYVVELMQDGEVFVERLVSYGVCRTINNFANSNNYQSLLEYCTNHKLAEFKIGKSINTIDDLFVNLKLVKTSTQTIYSYSLIAYGEEIPTFYLNGITNSYDNGGDLILQLLEDFKV